MTVRKCIYTDKEARSKDSVLPKEILGEEIHNWTVQVPCNTNYLEHKQNKLPTELEMQANEFFHLLELTKLRVVYYEKKLAEIQGKILYTYKEPIKNKITVAEKNKERQIEQMIIEKELIEESNKDIEAILAEKRKLWE
jgi:uncharacterized short protein YbdD (DUF466 family)